MKYKLEGTFTTFKRSSSNCYTIESYLPHLEDLKRKMTKEIRKNKLQKLNNL